LNLQLANSKCLRFPLTVYLFYNTFYIPYMVMFGIPNVHNMPDSTIWTATTSVESLYMSNEECEG